MCKTIDEPKARPDVGCTELLADSLGVSSPDTPLTNAAVSSTDYASGEAMVPAEKCKDIERKLNEERLFRRLYALPPSDVFWHNKYMFTKPVFLHNSRMGGDVDKFFAWLDERPLVIQNLVYSFTANK